MADNDTQATEGGFEQAKEHAQDGTASLLAGLAERIGASAGAKAVFGDPIENKGEFLELGWWRRAASRKC